MISATTRDQRFSTEHTWWQQTPPLLQTDCAGAAEEGSPVAATPRSCPTPQHSPPVWPLPRQGCGQLRATPVLLLFTKDENGHTGGLPHHTSTNWDLSPQPLLCSTEVHLLCYFLHLLKNETRQWVQKLLARLRAQSYGISWGNQPLSKPHTHLSASLTCWGPLKSKENGFRTLSCYVPWCPMEKDKSLEGYLVESWNSKCVLTFTLQVNLRKRGKSLFFK